MNILLYCIILSILQKSLSTNTILNEANMLADVVQSYHKPTSIAFNVCWKLTRKRKFISILEKSPKALQFIDNITDLEETLVKHVLLIIIDISCPSTQPHEEGDKIKRFSSPYRWFIFTKSELNYTATEIQKHDLLINSEVIVSEETSNGYIMRMPYKVKATSEIIWETFGTWTPEYGLIKYSKMSQSVSIRRKNLLGTPIVTSFVVTDNSTKTELSSIKNIHIDTISKIGYRQISHLYYFMNATNVKMYSDTWGYLINGTWTGMIGSIAREEADLTGTISFLTKQRLQVLDFLSYPSPLTARFVFREPSLSYQNNLFLLPFKPNVWICILALIFILAVVVFVIAKWEKEKDLTNTPGDTILRPNVSDIAIMITGAITQQGSSTELKGNLGRIVMLILFIAFVFLYTSYSANIIVLLQSTSNQIRTLTDLYNSKLELGSEDTPYNRYLFSIATEPTRMAIYQNKIAPRGSKSNFMSLDEGVKRLQTVTELRELQMKDLAPLSRLLAYRIHVEERAKEPFAFNMNLGTGYKLIEKYFYEHEKCGLQEIEYIQENNPWIACRKHSPYKEIYKIGLLRTQEHGLNDRENRLVYAKKPICSVHGGSFMSVHMVDFYPALLMLLYGIILSSILLLLEIFYKRRTRIVDPIV